MLILIIIAFLAGFSLGVWLIHKTIIEAGQIADAISDTGSYFSW